MWIYVLASLSLSVELRSIIACLSQLLSTLIFEPESLPESRAHWFSKIPWPANSSNLLASVLPVLRLQAGSPCTCFFMLLYFIFLMSARDWSSVPHACTSEKNVQLLGALHKHQLCSSGCQLYSEFYIISDSACFING